MVMHSYSTKVQQLLRWPTIVPQQARAESCEGLRWGQSAQWVPI